MLVFFHQCALAKLEYWQSQGKKMFASFISFLYLLRDLRSYFIVNSCGVTRISNEKEDFNIQNWRIYVAMNDLLVCTECLPIIALEKYFHDAQDDDNKSRLLKKELKMNNFHTIYSGLLHCQQQLQVHPWQRIYLLFGIRLETLPSVIRFTFPLP